MTPAERLERIEELAALVAAGAAEPAEVSELEQLTEGDPEAEALVRSYGEAASLLALDLDEAEPPPAGVLDRLQQRIERERGGGSGGTGGAGGGVVVPFRTRRRTLAVTAAVVVPLAAAAAFALMWWQARDQREQVAKKLARSETQLAAARVQLKSIASPDLHLATMTNPAQGSTVKLLVAPDHRRVLVLAFDLPPQPGRDYQLWLLPQKGKPIPAGLLRPDPEGLISTQAEVPPGVVGAAVTLEPRGGSPQPTTAPLMHGDLL